MKYKCENIVECNDVKTEKVKTSIQKISLTKITFNLSIAFCIFLCLNICFSSLIYNSSFSIVLKNLTANFLINPENFGKLKFVNSDNYGDKTAGNSEGLEINLPLKSPKITKIIENNILHYKLFSSGNSAVFSPISGKVIKLLKNNNGDCEILIENKTGVKVLLTGRVAVNIKPNQNVNKDNFIGLLEGEALSMSVFAKNGNSLNVM